MRGSHFYHALIFVLISAGLACFVLTKNVSAQIPGKMPVVRAVLFYRSTCEHCQELVAEVIPPILDKYKDQLQIFYCDISKPEGDAIFTSAIQQYGIKTIGVPTVIVGENVLIGSINIQNTFPKIIEAGLIHGGIGWPDIPGLETGLAAADSMKLPAIAPPSVFLQYSPSLTSTPFFGGLTTESQNSSAIPIISGMEKMGNNFRRDPQGNTLAVFVLIGMIVSVFYGLYAFLAKPGQPLSALPVWVVPVLCILGGCIAGYLAFLEITFVPAICGPVGHCQTVQQSDYARLFGILPIGFLGVAGYAAIILMWLIGRSQRIKAAELAGLMLLVMTASGTFFSIYLTFLEPFVIGASCVWCLSSAVLMTALMLLSIGPGKLAYRHIRKNRLIGNRRDTGEDMGV